MTDIRIDRLALDGDGIGRLENGQAAFVPYTLPGETVQAKLLQQKKNHSRWLPEKILQPSQSRISPKCPIHFKPGASKLACGGCDWQHMPTAVQEINKRQLVIETLERLGGVEKPPVHETLHSPKDWRYRNKVQVPFARSGKKVIAGFYAPGTHQIVEFEDCLIQPLPSVEIVQFVKRHANESPWSPYDEDTGRGWIRHLLVRTNEAGQALVTLVTATDSFADRDAFVSSMRKRFPFVVGIHQNIQKGRTHAILGPKWIRLWGADAIDEVILGLRLSCSPGAFFQVNTPVAEKLYQKALEELDIERDDLVLDIYCGGGALTLAAAKRARLAIGIESVESAIRDAGRNAKQNNIRNAEFACGEAEYLMSQPNKYIESTPESQRLVLLDPPRSGCDPRVLKALLELHPRRMVYVSCHPATLARDVKILSSQYKVTSVTPVDLFPQTSHIETVCRLEHR
ncbi:MAG: 23S rRNA (uracil-C(5))-methyltransferase RlmCD [Elusimicrobia bacterium]|nr:23S rRNA (uracil-C(5))-methyltransferase RlmCD [Elusimicrobiota bacterium]